MKKSKRLSPLVLVLLFAAVNASAIDLTLRSPEDLTRDKTSHPEKIIELVGVKPGDSVLDFLGGGGYYSELISRAVGPSGSVTLHNNKAYLPYIGKELEKRLANNRLNNVSKIISEVDNFKLGSAKYDSVFFVLGFHDLFYKDNGWDVTFDKAIPQLYKALKPGGKLLIIDHESLPGRGKNDAQNLHRIESVFARKQLEESGFKLINSSDVLVNTNDPMNVSVFEKDLRRKTNRFVYVFVKG
ncbi:class I SAM-dependent methyltransferase [Pleionea sediminis]|uniref:class I SAM-dependent methyltransferase n=1 Tax=Pleionea sediminis TaxID=2569479 RepID=UPI0011870DDE|nr:class I SAM-dependent methyltransferase [Pleionea sediminis]